MTSEGTLPSGLPPRRSKLGDPSPHREPPPELTSFLPLLRAIGSCPLSELPAGFADAHGLWMTVRSRSPFDVLLLDPQHDATSLDVSGRFRVLTHFWNQKDRVSHQGASRNIVREKYGDIELHLQATQWAWEQLTAPGGVAWWREHLDAERRERAWNQISGLLEATLVDGILERAEAALLFGEAKNAGYERDEFAKVLGDVLRDRTFEPDGTPTGITEADRIESVRWITAALRKKLTPPHTAPVLVPGWPLPTSDGTATLHGSAVVLPTPITVTVPKPARQQPNATRYLMIGALFFAAIGVAVYLLLANSFDRKIDQALANGHFFAPPGECAADLWVTENAKHPGSDAVRRAADRIRNLIAPRGDEAFGRWYRDSDETVDWSEVARIYGLLEAMYPSELMFKLRSRYADAQRLLRTREYAGALAAYNAALGLDNCYALALNGIGKIYIRDDSPLRDKTRGVQFYERAIQCDPKFTWAYANLGTYYMLDSQWTTAERYMLLALNCSPGRASILRSLGRINVNLRRYPRALEYYRQSLTTERDPETVARVNDVISHIRKKIH